MQIMEETSGGTAISISDWNAQGENAGKKLSFFSLIHIIVIYLSTAIFQQIISKSKSSFLKNLHYRSHT